MTKIALPRPVGATVLSLLAFALLALALPASGLAAPLAEGSDPVLTMTPATLPATTVGTQSPTVDVQLHNESGEEAAIDKVWLEGEDAGEFSFGGSGCGTVWPGQYCSVGIAMKPNSVGLKKTTVHVSFQGGRPEQSFELSGTSVAPEFTFAPAGHDYGLRSTRESGYSSFQLTNTGAATAQIGSLGIYGPGASAFWINNTECWGRGLAPGESCWVEVGFGPRDAVAYEAELQVDVSGHTFAAALSGEGGRAVVEATPNPADLGTATVGSEGPVRTITLSNSGNIPTAFFIGIVAGGDSASFHLLDENCSGAELAPGGSCTAHVSFRPQSAGPKLARLAFFGNDDGGAMVALSGEGVAAAVTLVPDSFDFGAVAAGTRGDAHEFAVRNEGSAPLDLGAVAIVGADLDQFALAGDGCTGETLAAGEECLLRVRFTPDGVGAKAATLRVGSEAGAFTAALTGSAGAATGTTADPGSAARAHDGAGPVPSRKRALRHRFRRGAAVSSAPRRARPPASRAIPRG